MPSLFALEACLASSSSSSSSLSLSSIRFGSHGSDTIQSPVPSFAPDSCLLDAPNINLRHQGYIASVYGTPVRVLGEGTGGVVHLHRIPSTGHHVAIKTFKFPSNPSLSRRMRAMNVEATIALAMQHPNIIHTHEFVFEPFPSANFGFDDGTFYAVMEHCPSELFDVVLKKRLTPRAIESLFIQLVAGVQYLHHVHSMAHRDLKLDNIVIAADGTLKIIDFGCSSIVPVDAQGFAMTAGPCGSDPYLPPEVLNNPNKPYDAMRLDVWSIAIIFLTMVTSNFPWEIAKPTDPNFRLFADYSDSLIDYWLPSRSKDTASPAAQLVKRMLSLDPTKRLTVDGVIFDPYFQQLIAAHSD